MMPEQKENFCSMKNLLSTQHSRKCIDRTTYPEYKEGRMSFSIYTNFGRKIGATETEKT
jgi:hypothetical protein